MDMEAQGRLLASWSNSMPTALVLARPEYLYELTFIKLLGSEVSTTFPDLARKGRARFGEEREGGGGAAKGVGGDDVHIRVYWGVMHMVQT